MYIHVHTHFCRQYCCYYILVLVSAQQYRTDVESPHSVVIILITTTHSHQTDQIPRT